MDQVGLVTASAGSVCEVMVQSESVELGSILDIGGHYGIVAEMRYDPDMKIGSKHRLIATVQIFGRLEGGALRSIKKPVKPNERARFAGETDLEKILAVSERISIGDVHGTKARACLNAAEYDRHTAILASTGAGKSYTAANLIKEFAEKGLPVLLVDTHGEYMSLLGKLNEGGFDISMLTVKYEKAGVDRLTISLSDLEGRDFHHFINLTEPQEMALSLIVDKLTGREYTLSDMKEECQRLDADSVHEATQQALGRKLARLERMGKGVFERHGTEINDLVEPGRVTIIDASMASQGIRRSVISYIAKKLLSGRINKVNEMGDHKLDYPLLFVVEEAHNFAGGSLSHSCKGQLARIASEGRKFGIGLVVISQKPSKIDEDILSQCNTGIYMHITNPKDKDHIRKSFEAISDEIVRGLDTLDVGECIIAGAMLDIPFIMCAVDRIDIARDARSKFDFKRPVSGKRAGFGYV